MVWTMACIRFLLLVAVVLLVEHGLSQNDDPCYCLEQFGTEDLYSPVFMEVAPGDDDRVFIGEQKGLMWLYDRDGNRNIEPFLNVSDRFEFTGPWATFGLLAFAFHPDFQNNRKFYVYFGEMIPDTPYLNRLSEFRTDENNPDVADMDTERVILDIDSTKGVHNGGEVFFGLGDDFLYLSLGDDSIPENAQNMTVLSGKHVRIDVDTGDDDIPYLIPEDNPFLDLEEARPEIYGLGLRNPWRCTQDIGDAETGEGRGRMICADVGQEWCEEMDIMIRGGNYAWMEKECHFCYPPDPPEDPEVCDEPSVSPGEEVLPIYWYTEWAGDQSVTGGHVYRGSAFPDYYGDYFWADWKIRDNSGLNRLRENEDGSWTNYKVDLCGASMCGGDLLSEHVPFAFSFGVDQDLEHYILESENTDPSVGGGVVYKMVTAPDSKKNQ